MATYPSKGNSLWLHTSTASSYDHLDGDLHVDVAIIGGGIAGLTTAYLLKKQGRKVAVFEKQAIGEGVTGYTTAKVTSQHGITYSKLTEKFGTESARVYGEANQAALEQIESIIQEEGIDCDWRREDNYVFTEKIEKLPELQREAADAALLGLPASFTTETDLPFEVKGAVKFEKQATFHIGKYLHGLARAIQGDENFVFEHTPCRKFEDSSLCMFQAPTGTVISNKLIFATNAPAAVKDHIAYALYEYPTRSYIVAGQVKEKISGMYISADKPTRSILPTYIDGSPWMLVGGDSHFVGLSGPAAGHYSKLSQYAKERFDVEDIQYRWSTWDFVPYDTVPLIGKLYPWSKNTYVITGLRKWGMTNATVGAMILRDELMGVTNPWADVFRTNRSSTILSLPQGLVQGILQ